MVKFSKDASRSKIRIGFWVPIVVLCFASTGLSVRLLLPSFIHCLSVRLLLPSFIHCLSEVTFFYLIYLSYFLLPTTCTYDLALSTHSLCNFLLLSLAAKGKKNTARSLCNFLLLSLAAKGKKTLPVPCVTSSSCPWQQKENSKQGRATIGQGQGQGRTGQGVQGSKK
jgi:hypothetical protein